VTSKNKNKDKKKIIKEQPAHNESWIPMRTGLIIVAIASIGMAVLTAWQAIPEKGWLMGSLYGLFFGGMIWVVFFGMRLFYRFTGPKR
jgi:hypothetical protein